MGIEDIKDALVFCEELKLNAKAIFEKDGKLEPIAFLGMRKNPETGEEFSEVSIGMLPAMVDFDEAGKKQFTGILRVMAEKSGAVMVITVNEIWMVNAKDGNIPRGSLEHVEGRKECVMLMMEHKCEGTPYLWIAEIERDGVVKLGEFKEMPRSNKLSGKFVGILGGAYN